MMAPPAVQGFKGRTESLEKINRTEGELKQFKKERDDAEMARSGSAAALDALPHLEPAKDQSLAASVESKIEGMKAERESLASGGKKLDEQRRTLKERDSTNTQKETALKTRRQRAKAKPGKDPVAVDLEQAKLAAEQDALEEEAIKKEKDAIALVKKEIEAEDKRIKDALAESKQKLGGLYVLQKLLEQQPWIEDPRPQLKDNVSAAIKDRDAASEKITQCEERIASLKREHEEKYEQIDPEAAAKLAAAKLKEEEEAKAKEAAKEQIGTQAQKSKKATPEKKVVESAESLRKAEEARKKAEASKRADFYKFVEADLSDRTARDLEQRLAELRSKIRAAFPNTPVETISKCPVGKELLDHVARLEEEVDHIAHKAPCHKCQTPNMVDRTKEAKELMLAKVAELKRLEQEDGDTADHRLAKALKSLEDNVDENGKNAGKMLGVLICEDGDGNTVYIYGYSGTLPPQWRIANAKLTNLTRLRDANAQLGEATRKLSEVNGKIAENKKLQEGREAAVKASEAEQAKADKAADEALKAAKEEANTKQAAARALADEQREQAVKAAQQKYFEAAADGSNRDAVESAKKAYTAAHEAADNQFRETLTAAAAKQRDAIDQANQACDTAKAEAKRQHETNVDVMAKNELIKESQELDKQQRALDKERGEWDTRAKKAAEDYPDRAKLDHEIEEAQKEVAAASKQDAALEASTEEKSDGKVIKWARSLSDESTEPPKSDGPEPFDGKLWSKSRDAVTLEAMNKDHDGTPHGVCSAPKMIQTAHRKGLKIVAMAEAWYGGQPNDHGELVASCNTCMKNIGFQLCDNKHD
ncbi:MAG TPA: hypothetical protein VGH38_20610 [Bryobacteraceae bacterium]